jgi:hypothetical protein
MANGSMDAVSAFIEFDVTDSKGNKYPEVITHVCATPVPVITGQGRFVPLSSVSRDGQADTPVDHYVPLDFADPTHKETPMLDMSKLVAALSLDAQAKPEDVIAKALDTLKAGTDATKAREALDSAVNAELAGRGLKLDAGKIVEIPKPKAPEDSPEVVTLKAKLAAHEDREKRAALSAVDVEVAGFIKSGVIDPALKDSMTRIMALARTGTPKALALSADGKSFEEKVVDLNADVQAVLAHVTEKLSKSGALKSAMALAAAGGTPAEQKVDVKALAARAQGLEVPAKK